MNLRQNINDLFTAFNASTDLPQTLDVIVCECVKALKRGNKLMVCGCGGSYCDAEHFCEELTGRLRKSHTRAPIAAMHLGGGGHITCVANDYGFDLVYERLVYAFGKTGDILIVLSTSGTSPAIVEAVLAAGGMQTVLLTGRKASINVDYNLCVESDDTARIQEVHKVLLHSLAEGIEDALYPMLHGPKTGRTTTSDGSSQKCSPPAIYLDANKPPYPVGTEVQLKSKPGERLGAITEYNDFPDVGDKVYLRSDPTKTLLGTIDAQYSHGSCNVKLPDGNTLFRNMRQLGKWKP